MTFFAAGLRSSSDSVGRFHTKGEKCRLGWRRAEGLSVSGVVGFGFQSRAVIFLDCACIIFTFFHAHMFDHFCEEPCLSQFILEAIFFAWRKLLDARKEDTKRYFIYKHWSRVVWRTWLELFTVPDFQPTSATFVLQSCGSMSMMTISENLLYYIAALSLSRHDMTDPGGAQERKSEEIRREHMRLAKGQCFCQSRERGRKHMEPPVEPCPLPCEPPCTTQSPHQSPWVMWANSRILSSFTCCQYLPKKLIQDFDPSLTPTKLWHGKSYVKWELKYIKMRITVNEKALAFSTSSLLEETSW